MIKWLNYHLDWQRTFFWLAVIWIWWRTKLGKMGIMSHWCPTAKSYKRLEFDLSYSFPCFLIHQNLRRQWMMTVIEDQGPRSGFISMLRLQYFDSPTWFNGKDTNSFWVNVSLECRQGSHKKSPKSEIQVTVISSCNGGTSVPFNLRIMVYSWPVTEIASCPVWRDLYLIVNIYCIITPPMNITQKCSV